MTMESIIAKYKPISLEEMSGIKLMNRIDTKFVTSVPQLLLLLEMARDSYRVQETGGLRVIPYSTLYFDTSDLQMYTTHHNGILPRQKVRVRSYVASHLDFLEVKTKNNHRRTRKKRIGLETYDASKVSLHPSTAEPGVGDFLSQRLDVPAASLVPQLENSFNRITLVNNDRTERLTIDTSLRFHNRTSGCDCDLTGLAIIELKRDGRAHSPVLEMLRQLRIKPQGFSKYCMGTAFTRPDAKTNRLKLRMRLVERLLKKDSVKQEKIIK